MDFRIGHGYDVHALAEGLPLVLGGVEIAHTKGCVAHSDGDVVIHALCDALLGAAALGDIGMHFPDTSDEFKGIDSKILLRKVAALLREKGYEIGNADCTIRAQRPKLRPHIDAMRAAMAEAMGVDGDRVSVKATTTEQLGFEGREEGISVSAVALIYKKYTARARTNDKGCLRAPFLNPAENGGSIQLRNRTRILHGAVPRIGDR